MKVLVEIEAETEIEAEVVRKDVLVQAEMLEEALAALLEIELQEV